MYQGIRSPPMIANKNNYKICFFDIDGTLIPHTSCESLFIKYLLINCKIPIKNIFLTLVDLIKNIDNLDRNIHDNKFYLKDFLINDLLAYTKDCFEKTIKNKISTDGLSELRKLHNQNISIILLSAGPNFLVEMIANYINISNYLATSFTMQHNKFIGTIHGIQPYGIGKYTVANEYAKKHGITLDECIAYGNAFSDKYLLSAVRTPIVVNPDFKLKKYAKKMFWRITYFR